MFVAKNFSSKKNCINLLAPLTLIIPFEFFFIKGFVPPHNAATQTRETKTKIIYINYFLILIYLT